MGFLSGCLTTQSYKMVDKHTNDGLIDSDELKYAMKMMGEELTDDEVAEIIGELDVDGDGFVSYEEFYAMMSK